MNIVNSTTKILEICKGWIVVLQNIIAEITKGIKDTSSK